MDTGIKTPITTTTSSSRLPSSLVEPLINVCPSEDTTTIINNDEVEQESYNNETALHKLLPLVPTTTTTSSTTATTGHTGHSALTFHVVEAMETCHPMQGQPHHPSNHHDTSTANPQEDDDDVLLPLVPENGSSNVQPEEDEDVNMVNSSAAKNNQFLIFIFIMFVLFGTGNAVMGKLVMIPMYNYPVFFNVWNCILYIMTCCLYLIPAWKCRYIPQEQFQLKKRPFAIMAIFDTLAGIMVMMSATYLPGPLLVLLPQAAIPFSMLLSAILLKSRYKCTHYLGALLVLVGIGIVLEPLFSKRHSPDYICIAQQSYMDQFCVTCEDQFTQEDCINVKLTSSSSSFLSSSSSSSSSSSFLSSSSLLSSVSPCIWESTKDNNEQQSSSSYSLLIGWSFVMILSTIPLTLGSIYKEQYNNQIEVDPIYINVWITIFQTFYSIPLSIPAGYASTPPVPIQDLPSNFLNGLKCFLGISSITTGCHPDTACPLWGPLATMLFLILNGGYSIWMILILKYGSANLMFLALTLVVPISNLWFALPFMPNPSTIHSSDIWGLCIIMIGLFCYRFGSSLTASCCFKLQKILPWMPFLRRSENHGFKNNNDQNNNNGGINDLLLHVRLLEAEESTTPVVAQQQQSPKENDDCITNNYDNCIFKNNNKHDDGLFA